MFVQLTNSRCHVSVQRVVSLIIISVLIPLSLIPGTFQSLFLDVLIICYLYPLIFRYFDRLIYRSLFLFLFCLSLIEINFDIYLSDTLSKYDKNDHMYVCNNFIYINLDATYVIIVYND